MYNWNIRGYLTMIYVLYVYTLITPLQVLTALSPPLTTITRYETVWCSITLLTACHQQTSHKIPRDVSEISIVSSWALTVVFHCEYQPRCWWISLFSANLVRNSYRPLWCQSKSVSLCHHMSMSAVKYSCLTKRILVNIDE